MFISVNYSTVKPEEKMHAFLVYTYTSLKVTEKYLFFSFT